MHAAPSERRRLVEKLLRELARCETRALRIPPLGEVPPTHALREVAAHAVAMRPRFELALDGHDLPSTRSHHGLGHALTAVRTRVVERMIDAERTFRGALLELRHAIDVVRVLRDFAREIRLFALIRWCDDWLVVRRPLVARVEAQLGWFAERERAAQLPPAPPPACSADEPPSEPDVARRSHEPDPGTPGARSNDHT